MAQLKDSVVSGNLRVTDTTLTNKMKIASSDYGPLSIVRTGTGYNAGIKFYNNTSTYLGSFAINAANNRFVRFKTDESTSYEIIDRSIVRDNTSVGTLGWVSTTADTVIPTVNTIAFWNGAYSGTSSNLAYCNRGAFGTIVTKSTYDYYSSTTSRDANTVLAAPNGSAGAATFRKLVAADIPSLSYLPLTGGNVSGNIFYKSTTYDGSAANNGVSTIEYPTTFNILDKSSRILTRLEGVIYNNGPIGSYWYVRNYDTSGTLVAQKGIKMTMAKDGTLTYDVSDGAKFRSAIGAGTSNLTIGTTATTAAAGDHTHGLLHYGLTQNVSATTTGGWSVIGIDPSKVGFVLKSIRMSSNAPNWLSTDCSAGIAFGGADTKGVISLRYNTPNITFAGGNHNSSKTEPNWYIKISGTSGSSYNLDNLLWATLLKPIATQTIASASTWNIPSGSYQVWGERFSDSRLTYTPSGGSATTITDTGDWVIWLTGNATANAATLNMRIDGTYYGSFSGNLSGNATTSTTASNLGGNSRMDYGWNGVNYFNISGTAGNAAKVNDTPTSAWWHIMRFNHANNAGYYTDLAVPFNDVSLYYKRISGGAVQNGGWVKVLDAFRIGYNYSASIKYDPHEKKFTCTKSDSAWNAQAYSAQGFSDNVYVSFRAGQTTSYIMIGLDSNPSEDADYKNIDYCWYIRNDGSLQVYESGTGTTISGHTTYATGDEFKVEYSAGSIKYYHNGVLCRRVIRSISGKLFFDSSFHTAGNIYNFEFGTSCDIANYDKPLTSYYKSESYVTSLTSSAITIQDQSGSFGGWMCGPTKNGRIAVASYQGYDDKLYFGYGERGRTTNSYVKTMTWDGPTNTLSADKFVGALQGNVTGNCSGTAGSTAKLTIASTNTASTSTNTYATNGLNIRWFNATGKLPGQPSQYGFCLTMSIEDGGAETHQIFATQANGSLYHRGTNGSSYQSPPAFATILDSSNYTGYTVKKDGTGASGSWGISITGNANTATIASQVIDTNINSESSEILKTSGKNRIYRSLTNYTRGNVFAFIPAADIAVEYSTDNGSNWTNMGLSNEEKANLFIMKCFGNVPVGPNTTASRTTSMKTRITITFSETRGHFDQITLTTASGGNIIKCDIYRNNTSTVVKTGVTMTAISNSAETTSVSTGNSYYINPSDGTVKKLIFIFSYTAASSTPAYIRDISAYGPAAGMYQGPSSTIINNMKNFDHLYTWDYTKKMIVSYGLSVTGDVSIANRYTFPATSTDCPAGMSGVLYSNSTGATTVDNLTISSNCTHLKIQLYDSTVGCYSIHDVAFVSGGVTTVLLQSAVFGQSFPLDVTPAQFKINTGTKSGTYKIIFSTGTKISIRNSGNTSGTANTVKMVKIWACS